MLLSSIFGPSVVKYGILSNNRRSKLHAVINWQFFLCFTAPSNPRQLELIAENATVVLATWIVPAALNGYLHTIRYRIDYTPLNGNKSHDIFVSHSSSDSPQSMTLRGLLPDTTYSVRVYAGRTRDDGVERWSGPASKTVKTRQLGEEDLDLCQNAGCRVAFPLWWASQNVLLTLFLNKCKTALVTLT